METTVKNISTKLCLVIILALTICGNALASSEEPVKFPIPEKNLRIYDTRPDGFHGDMEIFVRKSGKSCVECHKDNTYIGSDFLRSENKLKWYLHWGALSLSMLVLGIGLASSISVWQVGKGANFLESFRFREALPPTLFETIFQKSIWNLSKLRWFIFFSISIGFLALFFTFLIILFTRILFPVAFFVNGPGGLALDFLAESLGVLILIGTVVAFFRRILSPVSRLYIAAQDLIVVGLPFAIVVTGFGIEALKLAVLDPSPEMAYSYVANILATSLRGLDIPFLAYRYVLWVIHALLVFAFFAYLPFSKIFHVITCPLSTLFTESDKAVKGELK